MEDIYTNQIEISEAIIKIIINIKKDSKERRSETYFKRRLNNLESYWSEYEANHDRLREFKNLSHPYFLNSEYETTKHKYNETKSFILNQLNQIGEPQDEFQEAQAATSAVGQQASEYVSTKKVSQGSNSKLDDMLKKQFVNFKAFSRTISVIDMESISERWEYEDILKQIQTRWTAIDTLHWEIDAELNGEDGEYEYLFNKHEKEYSNIKKLLNSNMFSVSYREKYTPQINIPSFNGNYQHWLAFKNLFTEAIHKNSSLSNSQKMQFLKGKVQGEPERLIQHLTISSENYLTCWEILNHRYNNKKRIFTAHINTLLNIATAQQQSLSHIKKLHDTTFECIHAVRNLGVDTSSWDPLLVHILSQKLDSESYTSYIESLKYPQELPTLEEFLRYLEGKFSTLESTRKKQDTSNTQLNVFNTKNHPQQHKNYTFRSNYYKPQNSSRPLKSLHVASARCPICSEGHGIFQCKKFIEYPLQTKYKIISQKQLCNNCLYNHNGNRCISLKRCRLCNGNHHTLLHETGINSTPNGKQTTAIAQNNYVENNDVSISTLHLPTNNCKEILLSTAKINIISSDGSKIVMRALIDQGSQMSLISENAAQRLGLKRTQCKGVIFGVGEKESNCKGMLNITCCSIHNNFSFKTEVYIMNNLIKNLPNRSFEKPTWPHLEHIDLADPEFHISSPVDLLLGADIYSTIVLAGIIKNNSANQPIAQQTQLGWILCGNAQFFNCNVVINNIDDIQKFWEIEDISDQSNMSSEDLECINKYKSTTKRLKSGRYEVRLPLKPEIQNNLGSSKQVAIAQFKNLERKFNKNKKYAEDYKLFINEYINLKHMALCIENNSNTISECYLPHHGVERAESITTKLRVVFNASAKTSNGTSLNDFMYRGPNLQQDLQMLILKWRKYEFVFTSDIEKMFRNIYVHESDQVYQKIVWRESPECPISFYRLNTVTYGTKAAPFLALMTLRQLAHDERHNYPDAAKILENDFFVDDLISGAYSIQQGQELVKSLDMLLRSGGFILRKWRSNQAELLSIIDDECKLSTDSNIFNFKIENTKTLGLYWNSQRDSFSFNCNIAEKSLSKPTKRILLSEISKIFDPLGWIAPVILKLKLLFQKVWESNLGWDQVVSDEILSEWILVRSDVININKINISRWLNSREGDCIELHGFCDASQKAYACVVYARVKSSVVLVAAKTRLVPFKKPISLPKLELCGAFLLSKLIDKIITSLNNHTIKLYGWCDSMVVLGWLQGDPSRWNVFVANRVKNILNIMPKDNWRYVKSTENPADIASRGSLATELKLNKLWWQGPNWLLNNAIPQYKEYFTNQEERKCQTNIVQNIQNPYDIITELLNKYSSFNKIIRILAWVIRAIHGKRKQWSGEYLTLHELRYASKIIIKHVQCTEFTCDINNLKNHKALQSSSKLLNLNPFIDDFELLRVGGRLRNATINSDMKYPLLIPHKGRLTDLLIDQAHKLTFHGGPRFTLSVLRQKYWIIGGNRATKHFIQNCVTCRKYTTTTNNQLMGDLPSARVNPSYPFYHTGVDYTGYVDIKANKGRGIKTCKGYVAIFVCMVTKAVHLELVSDLSTSAFLAALRRMAARRGAPVHIYSDNGTNFVGANRVLREEYYNIQQIFDKEFHKNITELGIEWHFNAPAWPSAGGLWERAERSLKFHLRRVLGEQKLTFEEFTTLLARLEACLNSRPLCALSESIDDLDILTPAHFLTGRSGLSIIDTEEDARTRWQLTTKLFRDLWKRWKQEYLSQLSIRSKWLKAKPDIHVGDIVVIHDDNLQAQQWSLGRVVEIFPGTDNHVRVVTLRTSSGLMKRPITKLSLLPIKSETNLASNEHKQSKENSKESTQRPAKRISFLSLATTFILFMNVVSPSYCGFNITYLKNYNSLYLNPIYNMKLIQDKWTLVVYYNMSPYWQGIKAYSQLAGYMEKVCNSSYINNHCNITLLQLKHEYTELEYYNQLLMRQRGDTDTRRRRGLINGVGYVANSLFGVLDERFAEKYQQDIQLLQANNNHLLHLWKNQTSIIEGEYNLLKRTEITIEKQHKIINKHINNIYNSLSIIDQKLNNISFNEEFTFSAITANNLLQNLRRIQDYMLDTITDVHHGQLNFHLIQPEQLRHQLHIISSHLSQELTLPLENLDIDLFKIYSLLSIRVRMTQQFLILEINLPLVHRDSYTLYRLIAVPQQIQNNTVSVIPIADYVAINLKRDAYFLLDQTELQECLKSDQFYLCKHQNIISFLFNNEHFCRKDLMTHNCKIMKSPCESKWVKLAENKYLFFFCDSYTVRIICDEKITAQTLSKAGIVTIQEGCLIKGKDFSLYAQRSKKSNLKIMTDIFTPTIPTEINHLLTIPMPTQELNFSSFVNDSLNDLDLKLKQLRKDSESVDIISYHDIHQYTICYLLVAAAIAAVAVFAWRRWRRHRTVPISPGIPLHNRSASVSESVSESARTVPISPGIPLHNRSASVSESVSESARKQSKADRQPRVFDRAIFKNQATSPIISKRNVLSK